MQTTYLSMGSNIGDRQYYLHEAIRLLGKHPKIMIEKVSNFYESSPVGGVKQDDFTNLALKVATLLEPLSSSLSAIRVVSSAYLRLLLFLPAILIPAFVSSSPAFLMNVLCI